jgi:hypothetical protein
MSFQPGEAVLFGALDGIFEPGPATVTAVDDKGLETLYDLTLSNGRSRIFRVTAAELMADTPANRELAAQTMAARRVRAVAQEPLRHQRINELASLRAAVEKELTDLLVEEEWLNPCAQTAEILAQNPPKYTYEELEG